MKRLYCFVLATLLLSGTVLSCQEPPMPVSMVQLIVNPEKFDTRLVTVQGFLTLEHEKHHIARSVLFLHQEDAKHLLGANSAEVVPSEQMLRDQEKLDGKIGRAHV